MMPTIPSGPNSTQLVVAYGLPLLMDATPKSSLYRPGGINALRPASSHACSFVQQGKQLPLHLRGRTRNVPNLIGLRGEIALFLARPLECCAYVMFTFLLPVSS